MSVGLTPSLEEPAAVVAAATDDAAGPTPFVTGRCKWGLLLSLGGVVFPRLTPYASWFCLRRPDHSLSQSHALSILRATQ